VFSVANITSRLPDDLGVLYQTAQVASQQGKYLGKKLDQLVKKREVLEANDVQDFDEAICGPFRYTHLGSLAYIGNAAVFDLGNLSFMGGLIAMYAWRSVYWSEQVSARTRALLMIDWIIRYVHFIYYSHKALMHASQWCLGSGLVQALIRLRSCH